MKPQIVKINGKEYKIKCISSISEKVRNEENVLGLKLTICVYDIQENRYLKWEQLRNSYIAEKISDFARNSFNGQNTFYYKESEDND